MGLVKIASHQFLTSYALGNTKGSRRFTDVTSRLLFLIRRASLSNSRDISRECEKPRESTRRDVENGGSSGPFTFYINTFANVVRESTM